MGPRLVELDFPGWKVSSSVFGDLDHDNVKDYVAILQKPAANPDDGSDVKLVVYFVDWQGRRTIRATSDKAICFGCGGVKAVWNAPLGDLSIDKGVLKIEYDGGSREEFQTTTKWRYNGVSQKFLLIGETERTVDTAQEEPDDIIDINFLSLKLVRTIGKKSKTCAVPAEYKAINLDTFNYEDGNESMLEKLEAACKP